MIAAVATELMVGRHISKRFFQNEIREASSTECSLLNVVLRDSTFRAEMERATSVVR